MTSEEYKAALIACDFRDPNQVSELVTSTHTNVKFNEKVEQRLFQNPAGGCNYFTGFFGTEVWEDGQGQNLKREFYTDPYIPLTFSHFVKTMQVCDPNLANECDTTYCDVPEGGRGTLPDISMFKWGLKTPRDCIANIRHIKDFYDWARKIIRGRELMDEAVINLFYTFSAIRTLGHKVLLQGERDANNNLVPIANDNPRNPFRGFAYNYMEELFPRPTNLNDVLPLTTDILDIVSRHWTQFPKSNHVATGGRGELIFEFWYPDDWYQAEAIHNPDYMEKLKVMMPSNLFAGYSQNPNAREVIGNWAMRCMPWLPRFTESTQGGLIMVDTHENVPIEVGSEAVGARNFENAPFGIAMSPSPDQGKILRRPDLTHSGAGFPIQAITGGGDWMIRNDYDKDCNEDLNKPFSKKRYEMGFMMDNPDSSLGVLFRRRKFRLKPLNDCDLAPIFPVEPNTVDCAFTPIGCEDNKRRADDSITAQSDTKQVVCSAAACGNGESAPYLFWVKVEHKALSPGFNSLGCDCGSNVTLFVYDEEGAYDRQVTGVVKANKFAHPENYHLVETQEDLGEGHCIKGIVCEDSTPLQANVINCWDESDEGYEVLAGDIQVIVDSPIGCEVGDPVTVSYYDADGVVLGTTAGTLAVANHEQYTYQISSVVEGFACSAFETQAAMGVSCAGGSNSASSSSSSSTSSSSSSSSS